ncbi:MAG TPA: SMC family ATPase [Candidatus Nanoarchaeia archaeon]|nr:SMC family ATPase [Candidatus Nanoarchaeia archaeon]
MILKSLKVHNIRSYVTQRIDFSEGVTLLAGDIGSGKSSILLAIEFALFGVLKGVVSGESLLRKGKNEGFVELRFEVESKEYIVHRALRRTKTSVAQESGFLVIDGLRHDLTAIELKSRILDLLGYPKELLTKSKSLVYRYTVYTPQEEMKRILFEDREQRLDTLRRVFDVDKYKRVNENTQIFLRSLRSRVRAQETVLLESERYERLLNDKRQEYVSVQEQSASMLPVLEEITVLVRSKQEELEQSQQTINELANLKGQLDALRRHRDEAMRTTQQLAEQCVILESQEDAIRKEIGPSQDSDPVDVTPLLAELSQANDEMLRVSAIRHEQDKAVVEAHNARNMAVYHQRELDRSIDILKRKIEVSRSSVPKESVLLDARLLASQSIAVQQEISSLASQINMIQQDIAQARARRQQSEQSISKIEGLDTCPLCKTLLAHEHKSGVIEQERKVQALAQEQEQGLLPRCDELAKRRSGLDEGLRQIQSDLAKASLQEKESLLRRQILESVVLAEQELIASEQKRLGWKEEEEGAKSRAILAQQDMDLTSKNIADLDAQRAQVSGHLEQAKELQARVKKRAQRIQDLQRIQDQRDSFSVRLSEESQKAKAAQDAAQRLEQELSRLGEVESALAITKRELAGLLLQQRTLEVRQGSLIAKKKDVEHVITELAKDVERFRVVREGVSDDKRLDRWLDSFFVPVTRTIERHVLQAVHGEFDALFRKWFGMLIEDEMLSARLDDSFTPVIEQNGYEADLDALSGGEKTAAALAYRLALTKVINQVVGTIKTRDILALDEPTDGFSSEQLDKMREVIDELRLRQVIIVSHESKIETFVDQVVRIVKEDHVSRVLE